MLNISGKNVRLGLPSSIVVEVHSNYSPIQIPQSHLTTGVITITKQAEGQKHRPGQTGNQAYITKREKKCSERYRRVFHIFQLINSSPLPFTSSERAHNRITPTPLDEESYPTITCSRMQSVIYTLTYSRVCVPRIRRVLSHRANKTDKISIQTVHLPSRRSYPKHRQPNLALQKNRQGNPSNVNRANIITWTGRHADGKTFGQWMCQPKTWGLQKVTFLGENTDTNKTHEGQKIGRFPIFGNFWLFNVKICISGP